MLALHQKLENLASRYALWRTHCGFNLPADCYNGQREMPIYTCQKKRLESPGLLCS